MQPKFSLDVLSEELASLILVPCLISSDILSLLVLSIMRKRTQLILLMCGSFGDALQLGVYGIWLALLIGLISICIGYGVVIIRLNWKEQSEIAQKRAEKEESKSLVKDVNEEKDVEMQE